MTLQIATHHASCPLLMSLIEERTQLQQRIETLSYCRLGILGEAALEWALKNAPTGLYDLVGIDVRKVTAMNKPEILGWSGTTNVMKRLINSWIGRAGDIIGRHGGDEMIVAVPSGDGIGVLRCLLREAAAITMEMPLGTRQKLEEATAGVVNGVALASVLVEGIRVTTRQPHALFTAAEWAIDMTGVLKAGGNTTGNRNMDGAKGTRIARLRAA